MQAALVEKHWYTTATSQAAWEWRLNSTLPRSHTASVEGRSWPSLWWLLKPANILPPLDCSEEQLPHAGWIPFTAPLKKWANRSCKPECPLLQTGMLKRLTIHTSLHAVCVWL